MRRPSRTFLCGARKVRIGHNDNRSADVSLHLVLCSPLLRTAHVPLASDLCIADVPPSPGRFALRTIPLRSCGDRTFAWAVSPGSLAAPHVCPPFVPSTGVRPQNLPKAVCLYSGLGAFVCLVSAGPLSVCLQTARVELSGSFGLRRFFLAKRSPKISAGFESEWGSRNLYLTNSAIVTLESMGLQFRGSRAPVPQRLASERLRAGTFYAGSEHFSGFACLLAVGECLEL